MLKWMRERKIKKVINKYTDPSVVSSLILDIFDRHDNYSVCEDIFEDECVKFMYKFTRPNIGEKRNTYKVWIKNGEELILVFDRFKEEYDSKVDVFKIGYWIYHLYRIKKGDLNINETFSPELKLAAPQEEKSRLMSIE